MSRSPVTAEPSTVPSVVEHLKDSRAVEDPAERRRHRIHTHRRQPLLPRRVETSARIRAGPALKRAGSVPDRDRGGTLTLDEFADRLS